MADVLMGKTEVDAAVQDIVSQVVQETLIQNSKLLPTVSDYSAWSRPGYDTVKIPRVSRFTVNDKSENTAVDAQTITISTDDLALDKYKVIQFLLEDEAMRQSAVDIAAQAIKDAVLEHALQVDKDVITQLMLASASSPDHRRAFLSTKREDILRANQLLNEANVPRSDRFLLIPPDEEYDILNTANFVQADQYGSNAPVLNGEIGQIFGFKVLVHNEVTDDRMIAYHKSAIAFARQLAPQFETQRQLEHLATRYSLAQQYGVKVLDSGKRQVLLGSAS